MGIEEHQWGLRRADRDSGALMGIEECRWGLRTADGD